MYLHIYGTCSYLIKYLLKSLMSNFLRLSVVSYSLAHFNC